MNPISIRAIAWGRGSEIVNRNSDAIVELQVALRAVLDSYARHRHVEASIEPQCLFFFPLTLKVSSPSVPHKE